MQVAPMPAFGVHRERERGLWVGKGGGRGERQRRGVGWGGVRRILAISGGDRTYARS